MVCSLLLALALAAWAPARAGAAVDVSTCNTNDCCWRGEGSRERYCACSTARSRGAIGSSGTAAPSNADCAYVNCGIVGPPANACDVSTPPPAAQAPAKLPDVSTPGGGRRAGPSSKGCACTLEYAPVCAAGKTYPTACAVRMDARACMRLQNCSWWIAPYPELLTLLVLLCACLLRIQARCDGRTTFTRGACNPKEGGGLIGVTP
jgi:hypothetical protein